MAESFLEEIYQYANTVSKLRHIVDIVREHDDHRAVMELNNNIQNICNLCKACVESEYDEAMELWEQVQKINHIQRDLILLGDVIESMIIPIMERWIQSLGEISQQVDEEYLLESTACGFLTAKNLRTNMYFHSNNNPMEEARKIVQSFYDPKMSSYSVFGCGLGYHVYALYLISNGSVSIKVYDVDHRIAKYAKQYGVLDWIPDKNLEVIVCDSIMPFLESVNNQEVGMLFHVPSMRRMENETEKEVLFGIYMQQNTLCRFDKEVKINFWRNVAAGIEDVGKLDRSIIKEEMAIVAAGPSLDDNMGILRSWQNKKTIVAVGTVFKKLVQSGIRPDYVIIMDPQKRTLKQIEGVENEDIPLILDMTAYWEFAVKYKGPKYTVCIGGNERFVREYAQVNNLNIWSCSGTVASAALEFAIQFKARKIYLVGMDLAYPEDMSHASDTMDCQKKNTECMSVVEGVRGKKVRSDRVFISYREGIEERISETKDILYYNMSLRGARIKGTIECETETEEYKYNNILKNFQLLIETENLQIEESFLEKLIKNIGNVEINSFLEWCDNRYRKDIYSYIKFLSAFYRLTNDEKILYRIIEKLKNENIDCFTAENIRRQVMSIFFVKQELKMEYLDERKINKLLIRKWEKEYENKFIYIPLERRNKNTILIMTDQLLSARHAPSALVMSMAVILARMGIKVYLLVNITTCSDKDLERFWWNGSHFNVIQEYYKRNVLEYEGIYFPFMQVNYCENTENTLERVYQYVNQISPEFIWQIGGTSFIADIIGMCSTMIATKCTDGYAISEADVLASYMVSDSEYVKESLNYINEKKQLTYKIISPITASYEVSDNSFCRQQLKLPENKFLICFVGNRLDKEIDSNYIKWMKELLNISDNFHFVTIGSVIEDEELERNITQLGYQQNLSNVLKLCNVFVNPPRQGGGGGAVAALAAGIPALTLLYGDVANGVPQEFILDNLEVMKKVILRCNQEPDYYQSMCKKARVHFEKLSSESEEEQVRNVLNKMFCFIRERGVDVR